MLQPPTAMPLPEPKIPMLHYPSTWVHQTRFELSHHHLLVPVTIRAYLELKECMTKSAVLTKPRSEAYDAPLTVQHTKKSPRPTFATIEKLNF